jgi:N-acetylmuramoyl-L-alanine amidase
MNQSTTPGAARPGIARGRKLLQGAGILMVLLSLTGIAEAKSLAARKAAASEQFEQAEDLRSALEQKPERQRTRRDYDRVIEAYRSVYLTAPTSLRADPSAFAVAELLAEVGRTFKDPKALALAAEQYDFVRREYPGSPRRFEALLMIGDLAFDLGDKERARAAYQEFISKYPRNTLAVEAAQKLETIPSPFANKPGAISAPPADPGARQVAAETPAPSPFASRSAGNSSVRATLRGVDYQAKPDFTRIAIELNGETRYQSGLVPDPDRLFFDVQNTRLDHSLIGKTFEFNDGLVRRVRVAAYRPGLARVVLELERDVDYSVSTLPNPWRIVVDLRRHKPAPILSAAARNPATDAPRRVATEKPPVAAVPPPGGSTATIVTRNNDTPHTAAPPASASMPPDAVNAGLTQGRTSQPPQQVAENTQPGGVVPKGKRLPPAPHEAQPTSSGERSLTRVLGLKIGRIVIDAGHGGHDTGTVGPRGLREKDLVLDVALRLGRLLQARLGADVIYTRDDDTFVPLEARTAIANQEKADLFISIHANSSPDSDAGGIETYYLNFTSSRDALQVAARENATSEKTIHELQDLVKNIALKEKIDESREFAADVQRSLTSGLATKNSAPRNRGVKKAPFVVLIGAHMPSILAEISFVSNPADERKLATPEYRQKIAEALYRGMARYASGLSGVKMASAAPKAP